MRCDNKYMIIAPHAPPVPVAQTAPTTPQQNAALVSAAVVGQKLAKPTETQTKRAASAVGQTDRSRGNNSSTFLGHAFDSEAAAVNSQTNGPHPRGRGDKLDLSV